MIEKICLTYFEGTKISILPIEIQTYIFELLYHDKHFEYHKQVLKSVNAFHKGQFVHIRDSYEKYWKWVWFQMLGVNEPKDWDGISHGPWGYWDQDDGQRLFQMLLSYILLLDEIHCWYCGRLTKRFIRHKASKTLYCQECWQVR